MKFYKECQKDNTPDENDDLGCSPGYFCRSLTSFSNDTIGKCTEKSQISKLLSKSQIEFNEKTGKYKRSDKIQKMKEKRNIKKESEILDPKTFCGQKHFPLVYCKTFQNVITYLMGRDNPLDNLSDKEYLECFGEGENIFYTAQTKKNAKNRYEVKFMNKLIEKAKNILKTDKLREAKCEFYASVLCNSCNYVLCENCKYYPQFHGFEVPDTYETKLEKKLEEQVKSRTEDFEESKSDFDVEAQMSFAEQNNTVFYGGGGTTFSVENANFKIDLDNIDKDLNDIGKKDDSVWKKYFGNTYNAYKTSKELGNKFDNALWSDKSPKDKFQEVTKIYIFNFFRKNICSEDVAIWII